MLEILPMQNKKDFTCPVPKLILKVPKLILKEKNVFVLNLLAHVFQFGLPDVYGTPSMGLTMPGVRCVE